MAPHRPLHVYGAVSNFRSAPPCLSAQGNQFSERPAAFVGRDDSARRCLADFANGAPGRCVPVAHVHRTTEPAGETVAPYRHKIDFRASVSPRVHCCSFRYRLTRLLSSWTVWSRSPAKYALAIHYTLPCITFTIGRPLPSVKESIPCPGESSAFPQFPRKKRPSRSGRAFF